MSERFNLILLFCGCLVLAVACGQSEDLASTSPTPTSAAGIVPNLPSLSELAGTPAPDISGLPPLDQDQVALGERVYNEHCTECHGQNLEGEEGWQAPNKDNSFRAPPHDASGHTWHHSDAILLEAIRLGGTRLPADIGGTSEMPAFAEILAADENNAVLAFIKNTWPDDIRAIQYDMTFREQSQ